jgi:competence ComEA-like helix-hairpin-helix protein
MEGFILSFSKQEKQVIVFILASCAAGAFLALSYKVFPAWADRLAIVEDPSFRRKININTASYRDLISVRGIGPSTAGRILAYREKTGKIRNLDELSAVRRLKPAAMAKIREVFEAKE